MSHREIVGGGGDVISVYESKPSGPVRGNLIVLQELFGVNGHIRGVADSYAEQGYHVMAPAFFDHLEKGLEMGYSKDDVAKGLKLRDQLPWDLVLQDVAAARDCFENGKKTAVLGYCWGGTLAWLSGARVPGLAAVVSYYGGGIGNFAEEMPICPVQCHFGETDKLVPPADIEKMKALHPEMLEANVYPAGHGFNCDERGSFDAPSSKLARERTLVFLKRHLS